MQNEFPILRGEARQAGFDGGASPRLAIVAEHRLPRDCLAELLGRDRNLTLVATRDTNAPLDELADMQLDGLILEISSQAGRAFAHKARKALPGVKIVTVGICGGDEVVPLIDGLAGMVGSGSSVGDLVQTVCGAFGVEPEHRQEDGLRGRAAGDGRFLRKAASDALTPREREIAALLGKGLSNKEIARALGIGSTTVKNHVHNILGKLRVSRRADAGARFRGLTASEAEIGEDNRTPERPRRLAAVGRSRAY